MSRPRLHTYNGQDDHDRYEREDAAWDREQEDKAERKREEGHEDDSDLLLTEKELFEQSNIKQNENHNHV